MWLIDLYCLNDFLSGLDYLNNLGVYTFINLTMSSEKNNQAVVICCPLCEEPATKCTCSFDFEEPESCTIGSQSQTLICGVCGNLIVSCLCDFSTHNIDLDSGICSKCGAMQPGNQICTSGDVDNCDIITSTPKIKKENTRTRRRLFEEIPPHYVTASEGVNGFAKPEYEIHPIKSSESIFLSPGESANIKTNVILTEPIGKIVGFLSISGNPQCYWLGSMTNHCFCIKTGVLPGDHIGGLFVSIINKTSSSIVVKLGTNLGVLEFQKFI
jgi:hypothetical protein